MNFFRVGRSLGSSSCYKNTLFRGVGRSAVLNGGLSQTPRSANSPSGFDGKLGFLREYLVSVGSHKLFTAETSLPDVNRILANLKVRRFFSSEAPKEKNRNYEDFWLKERMEIPKGDDQKSESNAYSDTDDSEDFQKVIDFFGLLSAGLMLLKVIMSELEKISFEEFKDKLLEPGLVVKINVLNESVAEVVVRHSPMNQTNDGFSRFWGSGSAAVGCNRRFCRYYFNIVSPESFEEKLKEAQEALGINPHDYVPITYFSCPYRNSEILVFAPFVLVGWCMNRKVWSTIVHFVRKVAAKITYM